jgi:Cd2+/Zn2+-exporting ATPase
VNLEGLLRLRTTRLFEESAASRILALVEDASARKSRAEKFITSFARIYTPAVCAAALALAVLPPLVSLGVGVPPLWETWIRRALTFLVISCPCALVVSVPLTFFAGIGRACREGILVKGAGYLERLATVRAVAFDKTGTLTEGCFSVEEKCAVNGSAEELIFLASHAEMHSSHPIARSICAAAEAPLDASLVSDVREKRGRGVVCLVGGRGVAVGARALLLDEGIDCPLVEEAGSCVHVGADGKYIGCILLSDRIKDGASEALGELSRLGVSRTVMLTGDSAAVGERVAHALGIAQVHASLLPDEKLSHIERMIGEAPRGGAVAFVGGGINDSPVLSRADVGIAMGGLGSDAAIEAADVVLMNDDVRRIPQLIRISRGCMRIVRQNVVLAIGVKLLCLVLGAFGLFGIWLAVFADVGVMVLAVLNAVRALLIK